MNCEKSPSACKISLLKSVAEWLDDLSALVVTKSHLPEIIKIFLAIIQVEMSENWLPAMNPASTLFILVREFVCRVNKIASEPVSTQSSDQRRTHYGEEEKHNFIILEGTRAH